MVAKNRLPPCPRRVSEVRDILKDSSSDEETIGVEKMNATVCDDIVGLANVVSNKKVYVEECEKNHNTKAMEQQVKKKRHFFI